MMLKVFMKIPGVPRPLAVVGKQLFEDERFLVISHDIIKRKILWENILYVEEIPPVPPSVDTPEDTHEVDVKTFIPKDSVVAPLQPETTTNLMVAFTGAMNKMFTIENVKQSLFADSKWTPDLAQAIFTNPQIKPILGSFIIKECHVDGPNITVVTDSTKKDDAISDVQSKMDLVQKFAHAATKLGAPRTGRPSMRLPTDFSMSSSPFESPVPITNSNDEVEETDVSNGEEESAG
jgi:hypothetical protein